MSVYPSSYAVEARFNGVDWVNISADVVGDIHAEYGILGSAPLDRVADTGKLTFALNNTETNSAALEGYYSPGHPNCRTGFGIGLMLRLRIQFDGAWYTKWYGRIPAEGIEIDAGRYGSRLVHVNAADFMLQTASHEMTSPEFAEDKTLSEVVALVLANMSQAPLAVDYHEGIEVFPTVFDTVRSKTRATSEISKAVLSELGYVYPVHRGVDEVLRVEGRYTRNDEQSELTYLPVETAAAGHVLQEDEDSLLLEDGSYLLLDESVPLQIDNAFMEMGINYGRDLYNRVKVTAYPRKVDDSPVVLFTLQSPVEVEAGGTVTFSGRYRDPSGGASSVSGIDMLAPVANTDYLMNSEKDGSGTDLTAMLSLSAEYGTGDVTYTATSSASQTAYITQVNARGYGVYLYDSVDYLAEDSESVAQYGPNQLSVDMKYQDSLNSIIPLADLLLSQYAVPRYFVSNIQVAANRSAYLMLAFLCTEPGDRCALKEAVSAFSQECFLQGVSFDIKPGGFLTYEWYLKDASFETFDLFILDESYLDGDKYLGY